MFGFMFDREGKVPATEEQMAALDRGMSELEDMINEIEEVSAILEFNASSETGGAGRGLFRAAGNGAAVLAQQVGEDLRKWHEANEINVVKFGADHAKRLQKAVESERADQESQEKVRMLVRRRLFQLSSDLIRRGVAADVAAQGRLLAKERGERKIEVGSAIVAVNKLEARVNAVVSPCLSLRGELPGEMLYASNAAGMAVEGKRARGLGRRSRLPEVRAHLDSELMDKAEHFMGQRRNGLFQQYERQMKVLSMLEAAQEDRQESDEAFQAMQGAKAIKSAEGGDECWKRLYPPDAEGLPDSMKGAAPSRWRQAAIAVQQGADHPMPSLSQNMEEALVEALYPLVMRQGETHIRNMRHEFYQNYLAKDSSERARQVGSDLERWQLKKKCDLLQELTQVSEDSHNQILKQLNSILSFKDSDPGDHYSKTLNAAEDFHRQREEFFDSHTDKANKEVQAYCVTGMTQLSSIRRRMELACLKRWADVENGLGMTSDVAWVSCQTQLARTASQLVKEALESVRLEVGDLDVVPTMSQVDTITTAWRRCGTQVPGMLTFAEKLTQALPDTMGTCTVAKSSLMLVHQEFKRMIERIDGSQAVG